MLELVRHLFIHPFLKIWLSPVNTTLHHQNHRQMDHQDHPKEAYQEVKVSRPMNNRVKVGMLQYLFWILCHQAPSIHMILQLCVEPLKKVQDIMAWSSDLIPFPPWNFKPGLDLQADALLSTYDANSVFQIQACSSSDICRVYLLLVQCPCHAWLAVEFEVQ